MIAISIIASFPFLSLYFLLTGSPRLAIARQSIVITVFIKLEVEVEALLCGWVKTSCGIHHVWMRTFINMETKQNPLSKRVDKV